MSARKHARRSSAMTSSLRLVFWLIMLNLHASALQILFLVSWIHRDVSSGNILSFKGRGKLSDLEYAKEFNLSIGGRSSDPKTVRSFCRQYNQPS